MTTFSHRAKAILRREFNHAVRPELDEVLTELMEVENARGFNEYDAAIAAVLAILGLCGPDRINAPTARRTMVEMARRIVGVAPLGLRGADRIGAELMALARARGADAALIQELSSIVLTPGDGGRGARTLH